MFFSFFPNKLQCFLLTPSPYTDHSVYLLAFLKTEGTNNIQHNRTKSEHLNIYYIIVCVCVCYSFSRVQLFATPWTVACWLLCPWILQARILEWVAIPFSRGSFGPRDQTHVSCIAGRFFTVWVREAPS